MSILLENVKMMMDFSYRIGFFIDSLQIFFRQLQMIVKC